MPPGPPRPSCPWPRSRAPDPIGPGVLTHLPGARIPASARRLARAPLQAHVPPPRAPSLGREGGRAGSAPRKRGERGRQQGPERGGPGWEGRGGAGWAALAPAASWEPSRGRRDPRPSWATASATGAPHEPRSPLPAPEQQPSRQPPPPGRPEPQRRAAPRGRTRAAESGVPAPERRRGRRRANAGPWGAQTCGACGLRKVSSRVAGGCGGWESLCLGTEELRFAK